MKDLIPKHLKSKIHWVDRDYRINPLSKIPASSEVIVEYSDNSILGYDWIHRPSKYVSQIFDENEIRRVYVRSFRNEEEYESNQFKVVWKKGQSKSDLISNLKVYDKNHQEIDRKTSEKLLILQDSLYPGQTYFTIETTKGYRILIDKNVLLSDLAKVKSNDRIRLIEILNSDILQSKAREINTSDLCDMISFTNNDQKIDFIMDFAPNNVIAIQRPNSKELITKAYYVEAWIDIYYFNNGERKLLVEHLMFELRADKELIELQIIV